MPRKKNPAKTSASRYSAAPAKSKTAKSKEAPAVEIHPALPQANAAAAATAPAASTDSAATALIAALRNSNADVARDAATSLGSLGNPVAVQPLIDALRNIDGFYHPVVRAAAASSLGQLRDPRAVDSLLIAVRDTLAEPSAEAIRALAAIGDPRAIAPLLEVVRNRHGFFLPIARRAAVVALARFQSDDQVAAELLTVSQTGWEDPVIRQAAQQALESAAK